MTSSQVPAEHNSSVENSALLHASRHPSRRVRRSSLSTAPHRLRRQLIAVSQALPQPSSPRITGRHHVRLVRYCVHLRSPPNIDLNSRYHRRILARKCLGMRIHWRIHLAYVCQLAHSPRKQLLVYVSPSVPQTGAYNSGHVHSSTGEQSSQQASGLGTASVPGGHISQSTLSHGNGIHSGQHSPSAIVSLGSVPSGQPHATAQLSTGWQRSSTQRKPSAQA